MVDYIKNIKYFQPNKAIAVTINKQQESTIYDFTIVEKKKGEIEVTELKDNLSEIENVVNIITKKIPLLLTITGKGVLTKTISATIQETNEQIVNKILPNADIDDFYISKTELSEDKMLVSVIRKTICDEIISEFPQKNIVSISIGENQVTHLFDLLPQEKQIRYKNTIWQKENNALNISKTEEEIGFEWVNIGSERIHIDNIESWAHCLSFLTKTNTSSVELQSIEKNKEELLYSTIFTILGWTVLIFTFSILLINFLMFDSYNKEYNELSFKVEQNSMVIAQMDTLKAQIKFKEDFVKNNSTNTTRFSYYSDVIAKLLPKNIILTDLNIKPLLKRLKDKNEALFSKNTITVKGFTKNSTTLNKWVKDLKNEDWISDTEIIEYNRENAKLSGEFEVEIYIEQNK